MNNLTTRRWCAQLRDRERLSCPDHRASGRLDNLFCIFRPARVRRDVNASCGAPPNVTQAHPKFAVPQPLIKSKYSSVLMLLRCIRPTVNLTTASRVNASPSHAVDAAISSRNTSTQITFDKVTEQVSELPSVLRFGLPETYAGNINYDIYDLEQTAV